MSTSTALAPVTPESAEDRAASSLSAQCNSCLRIDRAAGDWVLAPTNGLTSTMLASGVQSLSEVLRGGPTAHIAAALMRLVSATRRPAAMDEEREALYFDTLQEAMHDYPVDCVEEACIAWRKSDNGEWWPAEKELRRLCEKLFEPRRKLMARAHALLRHLEAEEAYEERKRRPSYFAGDKGMAFKEAMRERMGEARFQSYFGPGLVKFVGEDLLLVRSPIIEDVLKSDGADLLGQTGLRVACCPVSFAKESGPRLDEDSANDRAETKRRFSRLKEALNRGENIAKLIAQGALK